MKNQKISGGFDYWIETHTEEEVDALKVHLISEQSMFIPKPPEPKGPEPMPRVIWKDRPSMSNDNMSLIFAYPFIF